MQPKISFGENGSDAVALGWFQADSEEKAKGEKAPPQYVGKKNAEVDKLAARLKQSRHFGGKKNEVSTLRYYELGGFPSALLLGLGHQKKFSTDTARQAGAALYLAQRREKLPKITLWGESVFGKLPPKEQDRYVEAFSEGYLLAGHEFKELKKEEGDHFYPESLDIQGVKRSEENLSRAGIIAHAVNFARGLGDRPGNFLTPSEFAKITERMAKERDLKFRALGRAEMEKERMGLFLGVARGSAEEPKLIVLEHQGGKKTDKPVALIGKGVTFDSGGISLKPAANMEDMKYDMMGAAAVAGILEAVAALELPLNVVGFIGATENMPGGRAQKPGDVARSLSGKTVEIINTDAEGRLVLADTLEYAQKHYSPQALFDFATLTGAVVQALGTVTSGIMGTSAELIRRLEASAEATGERVWELPLYDEYGDDLKSHIADIKNSGNREAGSSKGGMFLKFFIDQKKFPWAHCDIAGSAYHRKDLNYHPSKYGAGVMVRLMVHLLENWKPVSAGV